ncbi:hypothetical protein J4209_01090 [Candidatus Woesearchaeota archaeon]|nr:hypothetical protein [Candidatus Woesearchaeota archaeon]
MDEAIRKAFLIGLGAASLSKKKAEKALRELIKKGVVSRKEGEALVRKILADAKTHRERLENVVITEVNKQLKKAKPIVKKVKERAEKEGKRIVESMLS